jgi:hypothetical protein
MSKSEESKENLEGCLLSVGAVAGIAAMIGLGASINGFMLSIMWGWFIVPTFNLPKITVPVAIGMMLMVSFVSYKPEGMKKEYKEEGQWVGQIALPFLIFSVAWIVHYFFM